MAENPEPTACAVGLDVGGTKIAAGLVAHSSGVILARRTIPTLPRRGGDAVLGDALALAEELIAEAGKMDLELQGIGVGVPELVDPAGNITSSHSLAWQGDRVQAAFSSLAPAVVESDVRAGALAEAMFGAGRAFRLFVYVTVGTGISSTLVQDGRPFAGARGNALILASSPFTSECSSCGTALNPILEEFASGPALVARYNRHGSRVVERGEEVTAAAEEGDPAAAMVVRSAGEALGNSVGFLVNVMDPEAIVVGGGLGSAGGLYWDSFAASTRAHIWAENSRGLPILPAAMGADSGLIGAAATVFQSLGEARRTCEAPYVDRV
jgi:glucokinase